MAGNGAMWAVQTKVWTPKNDHNYRTLRIKETITTQKIFHFKKKRFLESKAQLCFRLQPTKPISPRCRKIHRVVNASGDIIQRFFRHTDNGDIAPGSG